MPFPNLTVNRTRIQDGRIPGTVVEDRYQCPTPAFIGNDAVYSKMPFVRGTISSMQDVYTPYFKTKMRSQRRYTRKGILRPKPLKRRKIVLHDLGFWKETRQTNDVTIWCGGPNRTCFTCVPAAPWCGVEFRGPVAANIAHYNFHDPQSWRPLMFDTRLQNSLESVLVKALAKANSSTIMTGEILGTIGQTLKMLAHPFSSFEKAIDLALKPVRPDHVRAFQGITKLLKEQNRVIREKVKRGLSPTAAISAAWLELRYGWIPILSDLGKILIELDEKRAKLLSTVIVARSSETFTFKGDRELTPTPTGGRHAATGRGTYDMQVTTRGGVAYQLHLADNTEYVRRFLGLRLRDVVGVAWELVPWSFVVDWFFRIGDYLEAYVPSSDVKILDTWYSFKGKFRYETFFTGFSTGVLPVGCNYYVSELPVQRIDYVDKNRKINPPLPWIPSLDMDFLSTLQTLDALALLIAKAFKVIPKMVSR